MKKASGHCVHLTVDVKGHRMTVCLVAPGNEHIAAEVKAGKVRKPEQYTSAEIQRALAHHLQHHTHDVKGGR